MSTRTRISRLSLLLGGVLAWVTLGGTGHAATLPPGFAESQVTALLSGPTAMAFTPDGRLLVCEQDGRLRVVKNGVLLSTPFVTLPVDFQGERGLLGVAVDPDFDVNQYVYVYYTAATPPIRNRVSRLIASGDVAISGSETVILELDPLSSSLNHNGGAIHFGADGKLYVAVGDNANSGNAQTLSNRFGKMLRINPDGSIPTDNPFSATTSGPNQAIWALGLRNPFNFAVQPGTGRLFVNDVGQNTWEEINEGVGGSNYGWPVTEGPTSNPAYRSPLHAYGHGDGCAITGAAFYNPPAAQFPDDYAGDYFFADFCGGWIRHFDPVTGAVTDFATGIAFPVDVQVASDGSLYYLSITTGALYRVRYTASGAPSIGTQPTSHTASLGESATFTVGASGALPLGYQWQRNGTAIPGATSASYTLGPVTMADNGASFRCVVSNALGTATSDAATLTVTSNSPPSGTITLPAAGALYSAGDTISYAGTATDPQQGTLPASAFTWTVVFHHATHTQPFLPAASGATSGSFVIPTTGETEVDVWYRILLTVTDSEGLTHTSVRDVRPRTAALQLVTDPPGLQVTLDGQPRGTPASVSSVVGMERTLGVVSPQTVGGVTYEFESWSDGGAGTHTIATPGTATSYTATFRVAPPGAEPPRPRTTRHDFDGDGRSDVGVYRGRTGEWLLHHSATGALSAIAWGAPVLDDTPVPDDYDGDGRTDVAVYRRSTGEWFIRRSTDGGLTHVAWGSPFLDDGPALGDYDGDGRTDIAVYRRSTGEWFIRRSTDAELTRIAWGSRFLDDIPVAGDYDGDGRTDVAVYRRSTGEWLIHGSTDGGLTHIAWGSPVLDDVPVPGDYDGDGRTDLAVYRRSRGEWLIRGSASGGLTHVPWGSPVLDDVPVAGDYDGDGTVDIAVYRRSSGEWYLRSWVDAGLTHHRWGAPMLQDVPARP